MSSCARFPLLVALLVLTGGSGLQAAWNVQDVDAPHHFQRSSLQIDPNGHPAVAYGDDHIYYASWDGSAWMLQLVDDSSCFKGADLAFDAAGHPAISYSDDIHNMLRLARWDGSGWEIAEVAESVYGASTSLAFDPSGQPAIAVSSVEMLYVTWNGTTWDVDELGIGGDGPSLAFDGMGRAVIGFTEHSMGSDTAVIVAVQAGSGWQIHTLTFAWWIDMVFLESLAIDDAGRPAATYSHVYDGETSLYLERWDGAHWDGGELLAWNGWHPEPQLMQSSLAFDAAGRPLVAYVDEDALLLDEWDGTEWRLQTVSSTGHLPSLALGPGDVPHIVSFNPSTEELELARRSGTTWTSEAIDVSARVGRGASLALDAADRPAVSYYELGKGFSDGLRFASWDGAAWDVEEVDTGDFDGTGWYNAITSLAFDSLGHPAVSYPDAVTGELRLARWDGLVWGIDVVADDAWSDHSLAFDPGGFPAVSYYATTGGEHLAVARWNGSVWVRDVVDASGEAGAYNSLAFDGNGQPAVSYHGAADSDLRLARWDGNQWSVEVVDEAGSVGRFSHLAFDGASNPAIAYRDDTERQVKLARWDGTGWGFEAVAAGYPDGLAIDGAGQAVVLYTQSGYAFIGYGDGGTWRHELVEQASDYTSMALASDGRPLVAFTTWCLADLQLATDTGPATLYRGLVATLEPGWRGAALPLTSDTDAETAPFPLDTVVPGSHLDDLGSGGEALTLYRVLWPGDKPAGNSLQAVKARDGVMLHW